MLKSSDSTSVMLPPRTISKRVTSKRKKSLYPHTQVCTNLLSDLAPEIILPQLVAETHRPVSERRCLAPLIPHSLLSILLRSGTTFEREHIYSNIVPLLSLPEASAGASLGFSAGGRLSETLCELVVAACRQEPLLVNGETLGFYAEAGHGAMDAQEYREAKTDDGEDLADVRVGNVGRMLEIVAEVLAGDGESGDRVMMAIKGAAAFVNGLVVVLPKKVGLLDERLRRGLRKVYGAYIGRLSEDERSRLVERLMRSVMELMETNVDNLIPFLDLLINPMVKFGVCKACLTKRFGVVCGVGDLTIVEIQNFLGVERKEERKNEAVPALLTGLISGWLEVTGKENLTVGDPTTFLRDIKKARHHIVRSFGASERDLSCFRVVVLLLSNRVLLASA